MLGVSNGEARRLQAKVAEGYSSWSEEQYEEEVRPQLETYIRQAATNGKGYVDYAHTFAWTKIIRDCVNAGFQVREKREKDTGSRYLRIFW